MEELKNLEIGQRFIYMNHIYQLRKVACRGEMTMYIAERPTMPYRGICLGNRVVQKIG